ncbi:MAG: PilZ domain-containing protein [Proteobacteria bacterium]|nr:PilZ domain-containing protein [Pseudomonadota bacterium]
MRWDPRAAIYMKARIQLNESKEYIFAETVNLSARGANLRISSDIPVGSKIRLELYLPNNEIYTKVDAKATVLWKDSKPEKEIIEIGVSLDEIENVHRQYITVLVRNLLLNVEQDEFPSASYSGACSCCSRLIPLVALGIPRKKSQKILSPDGAVFMVSTHSGLSSNSKTVISVEFV